MADEQWTKRIRRAWILGGLVPDFEFDAVIRESHASQMKVVTNPVEDGVLVSDHVVLMPKRLMIEGAVGDHWLHARDLQGNPVDDPWASEGGRSVNAYGKMLNLQASAEPFDVMTGLLLYRNMLIEDLQVEQDKKTATALVFRAALVEVLRRRTQEITFPARKDGKTARQGAAPKTGGEKKGDGLEASSDVPTRRSALQSMLGVGTPESRVIGFDNPTSPELKRLLGPGS